MLEKVIAFCKILAVTLGDDMSNYIGYFKYLFPSKSLFYDFIDWSKLAWGLYQI